MIPRFGQLHRRPTSLLLGVVGLVFATCAPSFAPAGPGTSPVTAADRALEQAHAGEGQDPPVAAAAGAAQQPAAPGAPAQVVPGSPPAPPHVGDPTPPVIFAPVAVQQPKLRVDGVDDAPSVAAQARGVEGVAHAAGFTFGVVPIAGVEGPTTVTMAAVEPVEFRVFTPQVTADAVAVWDRMVEGDAAFTHDVGYRLGLELGTRVPAAGRSLLRVGAFASNGVPPVADAIVTRETAAELGLQGSDTVLVSIAPDARPQDVARRLKEALGVDAHVLEDPEQRRAFLTGSAARKAFAPFNYIDNGDGMIQIDSSWVRSNIVSARVPVLRGHVVCHRLLIPQLRGALQEVADRGLAHLIHTSDYGGCWVPRHIDFNPAKPLSMHAWGLAIDFNVSTNQLGHVPQMDLRIVEIFQRWGFVWGGGWQRPDGMHFELGALLR